MSGEKSPVAVVAFEVAPRCRPTIYPEPLAADERTSSDGVAYLEIGDDCRRRRQLPRRRSQGDCCRQEVALCAQGRNAVLMDEHALGDR